ncbi:hypothetical protein J7E62_21335 [Variovorax paradoxus]|nr:hypothetical protein [Variovorax paradoxus]
MVTLIFTSSRSGFSSRLAVKVFSRKRGGPQVRFVLDRENGKVAGARLDLHCTAYPALRAILVMFKRSFESHLEVFDPVVIIRIVSAVRPKVHANPIREDVRKAARPVVWVHSIALSNE